MPEMAGYCFTSQIGVSAEQLYKAVVLEHVDCLQRPIVSCEVEVTIHISAVLPVRRKSAHTLVDRALLNPKTRVGAKLQIERIRTTGYFVRPISKRNLNHMQHDVRTVFQVEPKVLKSFSSPLPAVWI